MNEKDMAFEIAQRFIEMEAEIEARGAVLDRFWSRPDSRWQQHTYNRANETLIGQATHERRAELQSAFDAANDGDSLIHILHQEILRRATVS
jgi:hypothetical protein